MAVRAGARVLAAKRTNDVPASAVNKAPGSTVRSQRKQVSVSASSDHCNSSVFKATFQLGTSICSSSAWVLTAGQF